MKSSLRYLVAARQSEMAELEQIRNACSLVTRASGLIHQLQKERGLSNLLLASAGAGVLWEVLGAASTFYAGAIICVVTLVGMRCMPSAYQQN